MKVIFYIGHHKVGSTALQSFLARNWATLARDGILYPSVEGRGYAQNLSQLLKKPQPKHLPPHLREPHNALAYQMISDISHRSIPKQFGHLPGTAEMLEMIQYQVEALTPHTLILCAEAFANFGEVGPRLISRLCATFPESTFTVYCALRRPDEYLASWHGQRLKVGESALPLYPKGLKQYLKTIHFNYRTAVGAWHEWVPNPNLILRNYADVLTAGGSVEDFCYHCDLTLPEGTEPQGQANPSLPRAAFYLMERANKELVSQSRQALASFLLQHAKKICKIPDINVELFGRSQREQMLTAFRPSDAYLAELSGQTQFFEDLNKIAMPRPVQEQYAARQLLDAIDPGAIPDPVSSKFIRSLKSSFVPQSQV